MMDSARGDTTSTLVSGGDRSGDGVHKGRTANKGLKHKGSDKQKNMCDVVS